MAPHWKLTAACATVQLGLAYRVSDKLLYCNKTVPFVSPLLDCDIWFEKLRWLKNQKWSVESSKIAGCQLMDDIMVGLGLPFKEGFFCLFF